MEWLLDGDVAVAHRATRDLLHHDDPGLRARIATEGVGAALLAARRPDGHWGRGFYQPKWTSTHYTLLELRNLGLSADHPAAVASVGLVLAHERGPDHGLDPSHRAAVSDACINGMGLHYASWFGASEVDLASLVDVLLARRVADGGFNCRHRPPDLPVRHSSLHTTVSVLEGLTSYLAAGHRHRRQDVEAAIGTGAEFVLRHELFRSERTGEVIGADLLVPHHPPRWHFDILRGLECLAEAGSRRIRGWTLRWTSCAPGGGRTAAGPRARGRGRPTFLPSLVARRAGRPSGPCACWSTTLPDRVILTGPEGSLEDGAHGRFERSKRAVVAQRRRLPGLRPQLRRQ